MADLQVDIASRAGLDVVVEWAAREGWNPRLADAEDGALTAYGVL